MNIREPTPVDPVDQPMFIEETLPEPMDVVDASTENAIEVETEREVPFLNQQNYSEVSL
jgi:hypothetical protein